MRNSQRREINVESVSEAAGTEVGLEITCAETNMEDFRSGGGGGGRIQLEEMGFKDGHEKGRGNEPFERGFGGEAVVPVRLFIEIGGHFLRRFPAWEEENR